MSANKKIRTSLAAIVIDELTSLLLNIPSLVFSIVACAAQPSYLLHWVPHVIREEHLRIPLYYERWISNYIEMDFYRLFRMTSGTCTLLIAEIGKLMIAQEHHGGRESVPVRKLVLMTFWYLGKGHTLISIADRFNVAQSTVCDRVHYVISLMVDLLPKFIVWPSELESKAIIEQFKNISNYPGIMGAVDGCNILCKVPSEEQDSYQDRKFHHSIKLQGICTPHKIFINVCIGFPGSVHDARVLRESSIGKAIERDGHVKWFYLPENHLIGDSAYSLKT